MKKKTFLTFVCMIALLFAITGCGAEESESNGNNSSNSNNNNSNTKNTNEKCESTGTFFKDEGIK